MARKKTNQVAIAPIRAVTRDLRLEQVHLQKLELQPNTTNYGSARWAGLGEVFSHADTGLEWGSGVTWLGCPVEIAGRGEILRKAERPIGYSGERSMLTVGGSGTGKGAAGIIPTLAVDSGSVICIDPKGENAVVTARHRHQHFGQETYVLDPWGMAENSGAEPFRDCAFNPLGDLAEASEGQIIDRATVLANALVVKPPEGAPVDPFWDKGAQRLIRALIIHCLTTEPPENHNLGTIRRYTVTGFDDFLLEEVCINPACNSIAANAAAEYLELPTKGKQWMREGVTTNLAWIDDPRMSDVLGLGDRTRRTFTIEDLKTKKLSVYLVLPFDQIDQNPHWLRIFVNMTIAGLREEGRPENDVLFIMDEFAALGHLRSAFNLVTQGRGHGLRLWAFVQSLIQLKSIYKDDWENFVSSTGLVHILHAEDPFTSEFVSKKIGNCTMVNIASGANEGQSTSITEGRSKGMSGGQTKGRSISHGSSTSHTQGTSEGGSISEGTGGKTGSRSWGTSTSYGSGSSTTRGESSGSSTGWTMGTSTSGSEGTSQGTSKTATEAGRPLLAADEIGRMPEGMSIAFFKHLHPVAVEKYPWYKMKALVKKLDPHPDYPA